MNWRCKDASAVLNPITRLMGPTRILYAQAKRLISRLTKIQIHSSEQANRFSVWMRSWKISCYCLYDFHFVIDLHFTGYV